MRDIVMTNKQALLFKTLAEYNIHRFDDSKKLYKYVSAKVAKEIFSKSTLRFSNAKSLQAEDLEPELLIMNLNIKQLRELKTKTFIKSMVDHNYKTYQQAKDFFKTAEGKKLLNTGDYKAILRESFLTTHTSFRLFCATTSNNNSRMWKEYADNETGVCIEYKFPTFYTSHYVSFKVFYDKEFKSFNFFDKYGNVDTISAYRWIFTKREKYNFEDEVRIITDRNNGDFPFIDFKFPKQIFTGVYYGKFTKQNDIEEIGVLLQNGYSFSNGERIVY
jgi:Protein of unknown function (DUF2971)